MEQAGGVRIHRREPEDHEAPDVVRELARAKDRLAEELDANLRQLRQVIAESERIARELELVLKEVNSPTALTVPASVLRELERGGGRESDRPGRARGPDSGGGARGGRPDDGGGEDGGSTFH